MELKKGSLFAEGNTKRLYSTSDPDSLIIQFKDEIVSHAGKILGSIENKGVGTAKITDIIYQYLESFHIPTHWVRSEKPGEVAVKLCDMIPLIITMRNEIAGNLQKRYGLSSDAELKHPILELSLKNEKLKNPMLNSDHACAFGLISPEQMQVVETLARKTNAVLKSFFERRKLLLVETHLEFGLVNEQIVLADEIGFDTCRFWDIADDTIDKKIFDSDFEKHFEAAYENYAKRFI